MKSRSTLPLLLLLTLSLSLAGCNRNRESEPAATPEAPAAAPETSPASEAPTSNVMTAPAQTGDVSPETTTANATTADTTTAAETTPPAESAAKNEEETSQRMLPAQPPASEQSSSGETSSSENGTVAETGDSESPNVGDDLEDDEYEIDPEILAHIEAQRAALRRIADTYGPPPGAKQLGAQPDLWVDLRAKRVYIDGYVTMTRGPLEMLACPIGTKEHESVIAAFAKSSEVHAALLAIGAQSGTPVRWDPEFLPPTGQTITVWVMWRDPVQNTAPESSRENSEDGQADNSAVAERFIPSEKFSVVDARKWVRNVETQKELSEPWVFAGSSFWTDPEDGTEHYSANAGDMICVSNFSTAMLDVPFNSSADAGNLLFEPFTDRLPVRGTPVRLVLVPQPIPNDDGEQNSEVDTTTPPDASHLPIPAEDQQ